MLTWQLYFTTVKMKSVTTLNKLFYFPSIKMKSSVTLTDYTQLGLLNFATEIGNGVA